MANVGDGSKQMPTVMLQPRPRLSEIAHNPNSTWGTTWPPWWPEDICWQGRDLFHTQPLCDHELISITVASSRCYLDSPAFEYSYICTKHFPSHFLPHSLKPKCTHQTDKEPEPSTCKACIMHSAS